MGGDYISKKLKIAYAITISVIMLTIAFMLLITSGNTPAKSDTGTDFMLDPFLSNGLKQSMTEQQIQDALNRQMEDGMITISMNSNPVVSNGYANLNIFNDTQNKLPQIVEIYEESSLIYKSGGIPVGSRIDSAPLSVSLSPGNHNCTAYFNAVNPQTGEYVGTAAAEIIITIQ